VGLSREVHHGVDLLGPHDVRHEIGGSDIAFDEFKVEQPRDRFKVVQVGAIVELVDDDDLSFEVGVGKKDGEWVDRC